MLARVQMVNMIVLSGTMQILMYMKLDETNCQMLSAWVFCFSTMVIL